MLIWNSELVPKMFYLVMLETWELSVDKGKAFVVLLTDLSNVVDC